MSKKQIIPLKSWQPGLITNLSDINNYGYKSFKNISLSNSGQPEKIKGFRILGSEGNSFLGINHYINNYLGGVNEPIPQFNATHVWYNIDSFDESTVGNRVLDVYQTRKITPANSGDSDLQLIRATLGTDSNNIDDLDEQKNLSVVGVNSSDTFYVDWDNDLQCISTKDNVYIINNGNVMRKSAVGEFRKNDIAGDEYKMGIGYNSTAEMNYYAKTMSLYGSIHPDDIKITNTETGDILTTTYCGIVIVPIMNTGLVCPVEYSLSGTPDNIFFGKKVTINKTKSSIKIELRKRMFTHTDEFVIGYRVYRTAIGLDAETAFTFDVNYVKQDGDTKKRLFPLLDIYKADMISSDIDYFNLTTIEINSPDNITGTYYEFEGYLNSYALTDTSHSYFTGLGIREKYKEENDTTYILKPTCGAYLDNRLFINNTNDTLLYMSEVDRTDAIRADLAYQISDVTDYNPITAISGVQKNIFVFTATSIDALRPTTNADAPYIVQNVSHTRGCKNWQSVCAIDGMIYFVYENSIWQMSPQGIVKEVGANISDKLAQATDTIRLTKGDKGKLNIFFTMEQTLDISDDIKDYNKKHYVYYPLKGIIYERVGYRDIFDFDGTQSGGYYIGTLLSEQEEFTLVNGHYIEATSSFYGVTKYGELVVSDSYCDYSDISLANAKTTWGNYATWDNSGTVENTYNVVSTVEKTFYVDSQVILNTIILLGDGTWYCSLNTDNRGYTAEKAHTLGEVDTGVIFSSHGKLFVIKIRHKDNENIDISGIKLKVTGKNKITMSNNMSGGTENG